MIDAPGADGTLLAGEWHGLIDRSGRHTILRNHIGLRWLAYPFVWLMGPDGIGVAGVVGISFTYAFLDVLAKLPFVYFFDARRRVLTDAVETEMAGESTPVAADRSD
jgi:sensory rhodopsin